MKKPTSKDSLIDAFVRKGKEQNERLWAAADKRVKRFLKLAEKATTEAKRNQYLRTAQRTILLTIGASARMGSEMKKLIQSKDQKPKGKGKKS